jgi:hypothetical protein
MIAKTTTQLMLCLIVVILNVNAFKYPEPTGKYMNTKELKQDTYNLHWNVTEDIIEFEIHVKHTTGYVAFGLSPNGGMMNSDVIVAWIQEDGKVNFTDRFIYSPRNISIDKKQDWFLLKSDVRDGFFILKFWRKLVICDPDFEDIDIVEGKQNVIWSYGSLNENNDITYHRANRGVKNLHFLGTLNQVVELDMSEITTFQISANVNFRIF